MKYQVTGKNGKIYKRTTANRTYTHVIVRHWEAYNFTRPTWVNGSLAGNEVVHVPAGSVAYSWCGRPDLVPARVAEARKRSHTVDVEVIPVAS